MSIRLNIHLVKGQGNIQYNIGDVREMVDIGKAFTKGKE
jgi:hypothetical protein